MQVRFILSITLLFVQSICHSQVVFINKTKAQIKDYYSTRVSSDYFVEGIMENTKEPYFGISKDGMFFEFEAEFDKSGKCYTHQTKITEEEISIMHARVSKMGYRQNPKTLIYYNAANTISIKFTLNGANIVMEYNRIKK